MPSSSAAPGRGRAVAGNVDGANCGQMRQFRPLTELFPDLGRAPAWILSLEPDDHGLDRCGKTIGLSKRPTATIGKCGEATVFVAVEDLVPGFPGDPELGA